MSYLVLARKYRPQRFSEIVGQDHIVTIIKNALKAGKVWHSYIFAGMRGTGKTSTARILAKAVNCLSPTEDFEPCNSCQNCVDITQGSSVDVIEIDAASNRGINDIRALRESVKYVPVNSKYKVCIIDEAHQITDDGFNALLKTLEEPPSYVIFILATTEFNALPLTIVSRCQTFHFRPVPSNILFQRLKYVLEKENLSDKITEDALKFIAENSSGSVRDSLSLLDQVLSFTQTYKVVTLDILLKILGFAPTEVVTNLVNLILEGDIKKILKYINEIYFSGVDLIQLSKDLLEFFHSLLYAKSGSEFYSVYNLEAFKEKFSITHLIAFIQQLIRLTEEIKRTDYPKTIFEIYCIKLTKQYVEIDEILKNIETQPSTLVVSQNTVELQSQSETKFLSQPIGSLEQPPKEIAVSVSPTSQLSINLEELWEKVLEKIRIDKPLSYPSLAESEVTFENDILTIYLPNKFVLTYIESQNLPLEKLIEEISGKKIKIIYQVKKQQKIVVGESIPEVKKEEQKQVLTIKPKKQPHLDPVVEKIRAAFGGKIIAQQKQEEKIIEEN